MTSQLNVDTIVDKAGSGGSNVKMANTSTYVGEGGSGTQNTVQGLAKGWSNFDQRTSLSVTDSFNLSSQTDVAAGNIAITMANNMSDGGYVVSGTTQYVDGTENDLVAIMGLRRGVAKTSSGYETMVCSVMWSASGGADVDSVMTIVHGDLA